MWYGIQNMSKYDIDIKVHPQIQILVKDAYESLWMLVIYKTNIFRYLTIYLTDKLKMLRFTYL